MIGSADPPVLETGTSFVSRCLPTWDDSSSTWVGEGCVGRGMEDSRSLLWKAGCLVITPFGVDDAATGKFKRRLDPAGCLRHM